MTLGMLLHDFMDIGYGSHPELFCFLVLLSSALWLPPVCSTTLILNPIIGASLVVTFLNLLLSSPIDHFLLVKFDIYSSLPKPIPILILLRI